MICNFRQFLAEKFFIFYFLFCDILKDKLLDEITPHAPCGKLSTGGFCSNFMIL